MKKVLVLSGGGALGIMQLKALSELEKVSGKSIHEIYDMIVGTSVGAINGGILATGMSATDFLDIFYESIDDIFDRRFFAIPFIIPLYSRENFTNLYKKVFGSLDYKMSDLKTKFMCTSVNRVGKKTEYFKSWKSDETLFECIQRSFAAPYYFGQLVDNKNKSIWFDGGVGTANLPLDIAFTECVKLQWFGHGEKLDITCVTCGSIDLEPKNEKVREEIFNDLKGQGTPRQVWDFIHADEGGLARLQSADEKIYRYSKMSRNLGDFDFRLVDLVIPEKYNKLDAVEHKKKFLEYGEQMATIIKDNNWKW